MTELLVGTRKGLYVLHGNPGGPFAVAARAFAGLTVNTAIRDPRSGRYLAAVENAWHGPQLWTTDDPAGEWTQADGIALPEGGEEALERLWVIEPAEEDGVLWAGGDPAVLFRSEDGGSSWALNRALWEEPSRGDWHPGGGGLCLHHIVPWPGDPERLLIGISAVGVLLSDDRGTSWRHSNHGIVPPYLPEEARDVEHQHCVHGVRRAPGRPERLFLQFHSGVYRSDDGGANWVSIADGLPSDFGFPVAVDPADPDSAYVIPLVGAEDRTVPGGAVRVWETRDAGGSWAARGDGLPDEAWLTVLRGAFDTRGEGAGLELYFGATSGTVFGSADAGRSWFTVWEHLAPVSSVRVA